MLKPNFAPESATHGQRSVLHNGGAVFKGHPSGTQARVSNKQHFFSQNISAMSYEYWIKGFMRCYFIFKKITHPHFTVRHLSFETMLHIQGRLELADVCLTCFIVQDAEGELVQGYWDCSTVATVLYKSKNIHKCMLRLREAHPEICETHKRLWPQIQVPAVVQGFKQPQGETKALAMTTSWLISTLVWQFCTLKRSQDDRGIAAKVLIAIVQLCCRTGVIFNFLQFNLDQSFQWVPETMDQSGRAAHCWTLDFRNYVGEKWDFQRISGKKTWLTSPMSEATVWEFILFGLDPVKTRSCDRKLKTIKSMLVRTALNLCTEVAAFLDLNLEELSSPWSLPNIKGQKTKNKKRLHPWQLNSVAGHVFEMLRTGEDLWLHSFPTWMLYIEMDLGATLFILIYIYIYLFAVRLMMCSHPFQALLSGF